MSDSEQSFEADASIQQIAEDLERIKRVADLLRKAQTSVDAVLSASEEVITKAGDFAANSTKILQRLDDVDLDGRLTQIQTALSDARAEIGTTDRRLTATIGEASERHDAAVSEVKSQASTLSLKQSALSSEFESGVDRLAKEIEKTRRSLEASVEKLQKENEARSHRIGQALEATRKQLLIAVGAGIFLIVVIIVLHFLG